MSGALTGDALAAQAANVLIGEIVRSGWQAVRSVVAKIFHRDGDGGVAAQQALLEKTQAELEGATAPELGEARARAVRRWTLQFAAYLERCPDAEAELQELVRQAPPGAAAGQPLQVAYDIHDSQVVQALGDINAKSGGINYRAPRRRR